MERTVALRMVRAVESLVPFCGDEVFIAVNLQKEVAEGAGKHLEDWFRDETESPVSVTIRAMSAPHQGCSILTLRKKRGVIDA